MSFALLITLVCACQVEPYEVINIDIEEYSDFRDNLELAQEISSYARQYLAARVPSYDEAYERSISIGVSADTTAGMRAFVWVRFDYHNAEMLKNKDALKSEIREYFEKLAKEHKANARDFEELRPIGEHVVGELFDGRGAALYSSFAAVLAATMTREEWNVFCEEIRSKFGAPTRILYVGSHHYGEFGETPAHVSQFYTLEFEDKAPVDVRISQLKESGQWRICGYGVSWRTGE